MAWMWLAIAGCLEVAGALGLKWAPQVGGLAWPATIIAMAGSVGFLTLAIQRMPLGPSYAIWTGMGTVGTMAIGMAYLGEPCSPARIGFIMLILAGIAGLRLTAPA